MASKLIPAFLLALALPAALAASEPARITIFPPDHLSATQDTEVLLALSGAAGATGDLVANISTADARVATEVARFPETPRSDLEPVRMVVPASSLAPFGLGEVVTLGVAFAAADGTVLRDSVPVPVKAESAALAGGWNLVLADKPAQVYTTRTTLLRYVIYNPKNNPKGANIVLKFKGAEEKVKAKWKFGMSIPAGISEQILYVPSSVTSQARLKGATLLQSALMRDGASKAKDQALVDFDLNATAAADPASGPAPLRVSFTANATGGTPPYVYNWTFGDGSAASEQNPYHNYSQVGIYTATLTVTDTLGAKVTDDLTVTVAP